MAPTAKSASTKVFEDFFLTEAILLHLPLRDLLLSKRVCKDFQDMQDKSSHRIRKALFIVPYSDEKIYYPDSSTPNWYFHNSPQQGFVIGEESDEGDDANDKVGTYHGEKAVGQHGRRQAVKQDNNMGIVPNTKFSRSSNISKVTVKADSEDDLPTTPKTSRATIAGDSEDGLLATPKAKMVTTTHDADDGPLATPKASKRKIAKAVDNDPYHIFTTAKKKAEGRIMVPRVSGPFINPFLELIFDNFFHGIQGIYRPAETHLVPNVGMMASTQMVICSQERYADGTTYRCSRKTRAVQRYISSWRSMQPFSARTLSIELECFDIGHVEISDSNGLSAGRMMELLGEHWGTVCPDCCIPDFWFGEFVRNLPSGSSNTGNHGVRKLGLNNTGWETLAKLRAGRVSLVGVEDLVRPY